MKLAAGGSWPVWLTAFALVFVSRLALLAYFGTALPIWDQWDAEGWTLLRPFEAGTLHPVQLFVQHNEHRIVLTRLMTLAVYLANGHSWDNHVGTVVNAALLAVLAACATVRLLPRLPLREYWIFWFIAAFVAVVPYDWENTLTSLQGAFVLLIGFSLAAIALAAFRDPTPAAIVTIAVLIGCSMLSLASGALATPGVAIAAFLRARSTQMPWRKLLPLYAVLALLLALAIWFRPATPWHDTLRPQTWNEMLGAVAAVLSWPASAHPAVAVLLWLPFTVGALQAWRRKDDSPLTHLAIAVGAWTLLQAAAIAFSRGHGMVVLTPRYTDLMACGLLANAYFLVRLVSDAGRYALAARCAALLYAAAVCAGMVIYTQFALPHLRGTAMNNRLREQAVADYIAGKIDGPFNGVTPAAVPYPNAVNLARMLDDTSIRHMLERTLPNADLPPAPLSRVVAALLRNWLAVGASLLALAGLLAWRRRQA